MDIRKIEEIIRLLKESDIAEIEIKEGEETLRLTRYSHQQVETHPIQVTHNIPTASATPAAPAESAVTSSHSTAHLIRSPMVGTMYTAPSPDASPFVTLGQNVKKGDVLCIIEAMKMFNEIEADRAGIITAIHVSNGEPVEYDQQLFSIQE